MSRDLRDPKLLGETLLYWAQNQSCKVSEVHKALLWTPDYLDDFSPIAKYGRPQDLPETPF